MNLQIYKYPLDPEFFEQHIEMPVGAKILCVQVVRGVPVLYAEVDASSTAVEHRTFVLVGTGEGLPRQYRVYVGTFQIHDGKRVWHVFEIR